MWVDALPDELKFYIDFGKVKLILARDQEQVDKLLKIKEDIPFVEKVIWWEPRGLNAPEYTDNPWLMSLDELIQQGIQYEENYPKLFDENIDQSKPEDIAFLYYTSGTTGVPKAVMRSSSSTLYTREQLRWFFPVIPGDDTICYFQIATFAEPILGSVPHVTEGLILNFAESPDTMQADLREISPKCMFFFPRYWEDITTSIRSKVNDAGFLKRMTYNLCLPIGFKKADMEMQGMSISPFWKALGKIAWWLAIRPSLDKVGLIRSKWGITGGYMLGMHNFRLMRALNMDLRQFFGATEQGTVAAHNPGDIRMDSVGNVIPNVEVRISETEELIVRSQAVFEGYYNNPKATNDAFDKAGWFFTGDSAYLSEMGHLFFLDRASELRTLSTGQRFSPQYIEAQMRGGAYIRDCITLGDENTDYVSVILIIDYQSVGDWAERKHIAFTTFADLSQREEVGKLLLEDILRLNTTLPDYARIKKYVLLHKELDPDESELTRTRKLKRTFVEERYGDIIRAIYGNKPTALIEASVTYKDGRSATVKAELRINKVEEEKASTTQLN